MTLSASSPHAKQRWTLLVAVVATATLLVAAFAMGFSQSNWELDKNATNTLSSIHLGALKSSATSSATTITVCELQAAPTAPFTIQIDAENLRVTAVASGTVSTGGCAFASSTDSAIDARVYTVTRGFNGTTAAAHVGSTPRNDVTLLQTASGHDWNQVYNAPVTAGTRDCSGIGAIACIYLNRPNTGTASSANNFVGPTTFTQTTADPNPISQWRWTNQSVPDADEINDAFAAKYTSPDQQLFFGMDRYAVNGSKDIGFWFFHQAVTPNDDGTFSGAHCAPNQTTDGCPGAARGDLLLLTTFTQGGAATSVRAYEWVGSGGSDGTLNLLGTFGDCVPGNDSDKGCATVSNSTVPAPWAHQEKPTGASANELYAGGFMEGGIDLTTLGLQGCFASFLGTSRASPSITAQPKAFVLGGFEACTSGLTTTPADNSGTALTDTNSNGIPDISIGGGSVQVRDNASLTVGGSSFTGSIAFHICGPIASGTCATGGVSAGSVNVTANGDYSSPAASAPTLTSAGRYCWRGDFTTSTPGVPTASDSTTGECFEVLPVTPTLTTHAGTGPVNFGNPVTDTADLSGAATEPGNNGGSNPGQAGNTYPTINATNASYAGSISFTLKGPSTSGCGSTATGTGVNPQSVPVDAAVGNTTYGPVSFTPDQPGTYHWQATYSNASAVNNVLPVSDNGNCDQSREDVTVNTIPTQITTGPFVYPNDAATITSSASGNSLGTGGTVVFKLFGPTSGGTPHTGLENCTSGASVATVGTGGLLYIQTFTNVGGAHSVDVGPTTNTTVGVSPTSATLYWWRVTYAPASGDTAHTGIQSACVENSSISVTNDAGPGSAFP